MQNIQYPSNPTTHSLERYPTLRSNWDYSHKQLQSLNEELTAIVGREDLAIAVAGSYGRMDASSESDLDYFILSDNEDKSLEEIRETVSKACQGLEIRVPNAHGVFSQIVPVTEMIDGIGAADDNLCRLAQRMLLVMESRAIVNEAKFREIVEAIVRKYMDLVVTDPSKECVFFLNDVIRYFRSICVNYQFNVWKEEDKWGMRNVKLRHSRVLMYAGLLFLLLNASKCTIGGADKFKYVISKIELTPMEKIASVYNDNQDGSFDRILGVYNTFMYKLSDPQIRASLRIDYANRYANPHYSELKVTSDALQTELTRFVLSQRRNWTEQVFEYLLF